MVRCLGVACLVLAARLACTFGTSLTQQNNLCCVYCIVLSYFYCCSLIFLELHSCGFHCGIILRSIAIGIYIYICRSLFCHSCILCHCIVMNILSVLHRSMILSCYSTQSYIHYTVSHVANSKQSLPPSRWTDYDAPHKKQASRLIHHQQKSAKQQQGVALLWLLVYSAIRHGNSSMHLDYTIAIVSLEVYLSSILYIYISSTDHNHNKKQGARGKGIHEKYNKLNTPAAMHRLASRHTMLLPGTLATYHNMHGGKEWQ